MFPRLLGTLACHSKRTRGRPYLHKAMTNHTNDFSGISLYMAQTFIQEGKNASEAGYMVGYNSPAQFSREYKRHFGYAPSATQLSVVR